MLAFAKAAHSRRMVPSVYIISGEKIVSMNTLPTIPFQITLLTISKTSGVLIFLKIFRSYFYQSSIINVRSVSVVFLLIHLSIDADLAYKKKA